MQKREEYLWAIYTDQKMQPSSKSMESGQSLPHPSKQVPCFHHSASETTYKPTDIPFHMILPAHDKDDYNLMQHINDCIHFIEQSRQDLCLSICRKLTNVLIHCYAGASRSVAICTGYIMWKFKWNYQTAIAFMKAKRIVSKPNEGFVKQLLQIEQHIINSHPQSNIDDRESTAYSEHSQYDSKPASVRQQENIPHPNQLRREMLNQQYYKQNINIHETEAQNPKISPFVHGKQNSYQQQVWEQRPNSPLGYHHRFSSQVETYQPHSLSGSNQPESQGDTHYNYQYHQKLQEKAKDSIKKQEQYQTGSNRSHSRNEQSIREEFKDFQRQHEKEKTKSNSRIKLARNYQGNVRADMNEQSQQYHRQTQSNKNLHQANNYRASSSGLSSQQNNKDVLILGGRKHNQNHNSIPIPKFGQKSINKIEAEHSRTGTGFSSPKNGLYTASPGHFAQSDSNFYPKAQFAFSQSKEHSKTVSRCLIRPKDLPGYIKGG